MKTQNTKHKTQIFISVLCTLYSVLILSGCASLPKQGVLPAYNIGGASYFALIPLCEARKVSWDFDTVTRTVFLSKDSHKINIMVGQKLVLADGVVKYLRHPVDTYQGAVVVPKEFKEEIFGLVFKESFSKQVTTVSNIKKVVIDAGHGGKDPGAIGRSGTKEKYITLDLAKRLSSLLKDQGIAVVMTRSSDVFIPLSQRAEIANNSGADLFISIHANANRVRSLHGFEVYCVRQEDGDCQRARDSARYGSLDLDKSNFASDSVVLKTILWDMIHTYNRAESVGLASWINRTVGRSLDARILGVKAANFLVLKDTQIPAILIEVGFLSNYDEECLLKNSFYRQQIAGAIAEGIEDYGRNSRLTKVVNP